MRENADVFGFTLTEEEMERLESLTTQENKKTMESLYRKGLVRDTPLSESDVRSVITLD